MKQLPDTKDMVVLDPAQLMRLKGGDTSATDILIIGDSDIV